MIWQLIRRDAAWRQTPQLALASVVACAIWHWLPELRGFAGPAVGYLFMSLIPTYASNSQMHDVYFQGPLPITVRQIYLSRVLSMAALLCLAIVIGLVFCRALSHPALALALLDFGSLFMTAIMAIQSAAIQCKLRKPGIYAFNLFWFSGFAFCAMSGLPQWLMREGVLATAVFPSVCCLGSAAIFVRTWQTLPNAFDFAPRMLPVGDSPGVNERGSSAFARWRLIYGNISSTQPVWIVICFLIGIAWASPWQGASIGALWVVTGVMWDSVRSAIRSLGALPLEPRKLLASMLLPMFLSVPLGYAAGLHISRLADNMERGVIVTSSADSEIASPTKDCQMFNVIPPDEFLLPARADHAPVIQAPWGETIHPATNRLFKSDLYNPYTTGCNNSERFLDWQFARATTAVYGHPITRDRKAGSYVVSSPVGIPRIRRQLLTIGGIAGYQMLSAIIWMLDDWRRLKLLGRVPRRLLVPLAGLASFPCLFVIGLLSPWGLPANLFGTLAIVIVVLALLYLAVEAVFRQLEFDPPRIRRLR